MTFVTPPIDSSGGSPTPGEARQRNDSTASASASTVWSPSRVAVDHLRAHEMACTPLQPSVGFPSVELQIDEADTLGSSQCVSIRALQRGARDDDVLVLAHRSTYGREPGPAVIVGQRGTRCHLRDVRRRMELVGFHETGLSSRRQLRRERGLAGTGNPHHDDAECGHASPLVAADSTALASAARRGASSSSDAPYERSWPSASVRRSSQT